MVFSHAHKQLKPTAKIAFESRTAQKVTFNANNPLNCVDAVSRQFSKEGWGAGYFSVPLQEGTLTLVALWAEHNENTESRSVHLPAIQALKEKCKICDAEMLCHHKHKCCP